MKLKILLPLLFMSFLVSAQDGSLDTSFGDNGVSTLNIPSNPHNSIIDINGRIIISGRWPETVNEYYNFIMVIQENGDIDTSFGDDGFIIRSEYVGGSSPDEAFWRVEPQSSAKIIVLKGSTSKYFMSRLLSNGETDISFGDDGTVVISEEVFSTEVGRYFPGDFFVDSNDNILVGYSDGISQLTLKRFLPDGAIDTSFGINGVQTHTLNAESISFRDDMTFTHDGKLLISIRVFSNDVITNEIIRINEDGSLDKSFGMLGRAEIPIYKNYECDNIEIFSDQSFLVGCDQKLWGDENFMYKFTENGDIFSTFGGNNGFVPYQSGELVQPNDRIISLNKFYDYQTATPGMNPERYFGWGSPDSSWDFGGITDTRPVSIHLTKEDKLLIVAYRENILILQQLNNTPLGTSENSKSRFTFSPNPTNDFVTISCAECSLTNKPYQITDATGKLIKQDTFSVENPTVSMEGFAAGLYYLTIENTTVKLLKQ